MQKARRVGKGRDNEPVVFREVGDKDMIVINSYGRKKE